MCISFFLSALLILEALRLLHALVQIFTVIKLTDTSEQASDTPAISKGRRSHIFEHERKEWAIPVEACVRTFGGEPGAEYGVAPKQFPVGLASVPLTVTLPSDRKKTLDLVGGFLAMRQDPEDFGLSPVIGWAVTEPVPTNRVILG